MPRTKRKKTRTHVAEDGVSGRKGIAGSTNGKSALLDGTGRNSSDGTNRKVPKSLVIRRGKTAIEVNDLVQDLRYMMMPYTALHFQENPKNRKLTISQYTKHLALPMGISHILCFTQNSSTNANTNTNTNTSTDQSINTKNTDTVPTGSGNGSASGSASGGSGDYLNLTIVRTPDGPTLQFRVVQFSLSKHIRALQKRPINNAASVYTTTPPIVVTNNFGDHTAAPHVKLLRITFQNMFPQINVSTIQLKDCRRVVLFNLITKTEPAGGTTKQYVEIRQYSIKATPVGVNKRIRRLVQSKIPNLNKCNDIADYLHGNVILSDAPSDSEPEDDENGPNNSIVQLPDTYVGKGNNKSQKSALKLIEMGPRLTLELIKVQKQLCSGDVLFHSYIKKSYNEVIAIKQRVQDATALKEQRRQQQEQNVERKRLAALEKKSSIQQQQSKKRKIDTEDSNNDDDDDDDDNEAIDDDLNDNEEQDDDLNDNEEQDDDDEVEDQDDDDDEEED